jgi:hypothetical protein
MKGCRGEMHKGAKLTEKDIRYIRSSSFSNAFLAIELNVSAMTISMIRRRKSWKHVQ